MERNNGFLDLNKYFNKFTEKEIAENFLIIPSNWGINHYWMVINGESYYFKPTNAPYNELICYEIAKLFNMDAVSCDLASYNDRTGVISKDYRKDNCKYIPGYKLLEYYYNDQKHIVNEMGLENINWKDNYEGPFYIHMNNLETIWQALEYLYYKRDKEQINKCFLKIINQFMFAILTCQYDKGAQNWELEDDGKNIEIVPIFDNEGSYSDIDYLSAMSTGFEDVDNTIPKVLERFLKISSSEFIDLFLKYYNLLTEEKMYEIFKTIETKTGTLIPVEVTNEIISNFNLNRKNIEEVLDKLKIENSHGR